MFKVDEKITIERERDDALRAQPFPFSTDIDSHILYTSFLTIP